MKYDVITIGSATRDVLLTSDMLTVVADSHSETGQSECLPLGSKIAIKDLVFATGGGGTNAAVTFARQGMKTACIGIVGGDSEGAEILAELEREQVDTQFFQKHADQPTAYSIIMVHSSGERTILSYKGEGQHLDPAEIPWDQLEASWFYLDSLGGHYELAERAIAYASQKGIKVAWNPGAAELAHGWDKLAPLLKNIQVYITNKEEAALLTALPSSDMEAVMTKLSSAVDGIVIITNGHKGVWVKADGRLLAAGTPESPRLDATGAGDAFGSGFVAEYSRSGDVVKAIQYATANATSVVGKFGAKAGILKKGDCGSWPLIDVQ